MKLIGKAVLAAAALVAAIPVSASDNILWYQTPARDWMEGTPLGNGRLGAIVYGGIDRERVALNEITLWSGQRDTIQNTICGPEKLAEIRSHFFNGDYKTANDLTIQNLSGTRQNFGTHLPLGDLTIVSQYPEGELTGFRRELNLADAVSRTTFTKGGVTFTREMICDYPDDVIAIRLTADRKGALTSEFGFDLLRDADIISAPDGITLKGKVNFPMHGEGGVNFATDLRLDVKGGTVTPAGKTVKVCDADEIIAYVDIRTDMFDPDYMATASATTAKARTKGFDSLKAEHIADHSALFNRMAIDLGTPGEMSKLPTDVRLHLVKNGAKDADFDALFFQYGRYMQIASSRPGSPLCSNLQGIWNDNRACHMAWTCDYHLDINIEQNYWSANKANLAETNEPLFTFVGLLDKYGRETAEKVYGSKGWVAHTCVNPWGYTAPDGAIYWGLNVTAGAWLATHLWSHYRYTLDRDYLANIGYPLLKGCAEFFHGYMVEDPATGYLVTGPSISPENGFVTPEGDGLSASMMPTIDRGIVADIYTACIESSKILGVDKEFRKQLEKDLDKFPPITTDANGEVQEWLHGFPRQDPAHRHTSHLLTLYPLAQLTYTRTPALMDAARTTITNQTTANGWEDTEWSAANMICFNSFLKDGEKAHYWLQDLFRHFTRENLMTVSPAGIAGAGEDIFSFDATEASVAGMCDMLLQSHDGFIEFLPALPAIWHTGSVRGICAEGALTADLDWAEGAMRQARITAGAQTECRMLLPEGATLSLNGSEIKVKADKNGLTSVKMAPEDLLAINF
ncbi:MAG: glycoside hydrolase family 95 protein [Bacteroidales bacterium]|nr:glycoside hydrolase family 95 protein [Bacteroidales bacterium]